MSDAISPAGRWRIALLEVGAARHPGAWIGPGYPEWYWSPMNVVLLRSPEQTVLIDAGPGITGSWWPFEGFHADTEAALASAGAEPTDIDLVILTHLDYDHAGGLLAGSWPDHLELAFPRAPVVLHEDAVAAAQVADPDARDNVGTRLVALIERRGRLVSVADGAEVAAGVRVRSAPGHRAGHMIVEVDGREPFVHAADTLHDEAHVAHPEWDTAADENPEVALATRRKLLADLADSGARATVAHMPGPHAFRITGEHGALRLTPVVGPGN
jgi:glyoxylase-like metal-dependent hydrolase (beta-lactamase superfamily II)